MAIGGGGGVGGGGSGVGGGGLGEYALEYLPRGTKGGEEGRAAKGGMKGAYRAGDAPGGDGGLCDWRRALGGDTKVEDQVAGAVGCVGEDLPRGTKGGEVGRASTKGGEEGGASKPSNVPTG